MRLIAQEITNGLVILTARQQHYLQTVMRAKDGQRLEVIDEHGTLYEAKLSFKDGILHCRLTGVLREAVTPSLKLILCPSIIKGQRMDWLIEKAVEVGVDEIRPIITKHSIVKDTHKLNRWSKIVQEATRQSKRLSIPVIAEPIEFEGLFKSLTPAGFIMWEKATNGVKDAVKQFLLRHPKPKEVYILTGPEGSFAQTELEIALRHGLFACKIGNEILRAETAGVVSAVLVKQYLCDLVE